MSKLRNIAERFIPAGFARWKRNLNGDAKRFLEFAPPGHFYSPIPGKDDLQRRETGRQEIRDIDLNREGQRQILLELSQYYGELPFKETKAPDHRYFFVQHWYPYADAIYLYGLMRHFRPKRYIEVGSGFSSAAALDTDDRFLGGSVKFTFIEPHPERLTELLDTTDATRYKLVRRPVQEVPLEVFDDLQPNDILLIDSSHVCKVGSDVNYLLFHVLPRVRPGVLIHFHDIFFPFEYCDEWFRLGRAWNEIYLIRAFLQNNSAYTILLFASYVGQQFSDLLKEKMPLCLKNTGGALWMQKIGS